MRHFFYFFSLYFQNAHFSFVSRGGWGILLVLGNFTFSRFCRTLPGLCVSLLKLLSTPRGLFENFSFDVYCIFAFKKGFNFLRFSGAFSPIKSYWVETFTPKLFYNHKNRQKSTKVNKIFSVFPSIREKVFSQKRR